MKTGAEIGFAIWLTFWLTVAIASVDKVPKQERNGEEGIVIVFFVTVVPALLGYFIGRG